MATAGIRNVSKTPRTGGGLLKSNPTGNAYPSTDQTFNEEYTKKGLQPLGLGNNETGNESAQKRASSDAANDPSYYSEAANDPEYHNTKQGSARQKLSLKNAAGEKIVKALALKTRVSAVNYSIFAWGGSLWLFVQLPLSLLFLVTLGLIGVIQGGADANILTKAVAGIINTVTTAAGYLVGFEGNLSDLAGGYMLILYVLLIAIGFISLFVAFLQYIMAFLNPLGGEAAGLKKGIFLLCLFGYSAPIFNMFPWVLLFMAVVWKYPR